MNEEGLMGGAKILMTGNYVIRKEKEPCREDQIKISPKNMNPMMVLLVIRCNNQN